MFSSYNGSAVTSINKDSGEAEIPWVLVPSNLGLQRAIQTQHPMEYNKLSIRVTWYVSPTSRHDSLS